MKTIGLTFKGESVENVEKHVENTKAPLNVNPIVFIRCHPFDYLWCK